MYFVSTSDDEESPLMCHDNNILLGARMLSLILVSWLVEHCGHLPQAQVRDWALQEPLE